MSCNPDIPNLPYQVENNLPYQVEKPLFNFVKPICLFCQANFISKVMEWHRKTLQFLQEFA